MHPKQMETSSGQQYSENGRKLQQVW